MRLNATAAFSQSANGRTPLDVFATELGVYELDTAARAVRVWQRSGEGLELFLPSGGAAMQPFTKTQVQYASPRPQHFSGIDAAGAGSAFNAPLGMAKHPTEEKFAVVSGGEYKETKLVKNIPSVQVYSFAETAGDGDSLESVEISLEREFCEAFFTTTNGMEQVLLGYTNIVTITGTNVVLGVSSNWIYVVSTDPLLTETNDWENARLPENRPPPDVPEFPDERFVVLRDGFEYPAVITRTWFDGTTNVTTQPLYGFVYDVTTNASYLSSATDVAFLGDVGLVVPISDCGYSELYNDKQWDTDHWVTVVHEVSGLVFFDLSDPAKQGVVFPCATNLPGKIAGVDVDPDTGDVYVAVPSASAVYRYNAPTHGDPSSWLSLADRTVIVQDPDFVAGVPSMPGSGTGFLSAPEDVSVWSPDAGGLILLVADRGNDRVAAFDPNSTWTLTNWLGTSFSAPLTPDGVPVDPALGRVFVPGENVVLTNWYRVETPAFPLFAVSETANSLSKPVGVFGLPGEAVLGVAGGATGKDVRLYEIALDELDSDDVLAMAVYWPGAHEGYPELSVRDFALAKDGAGSDVVLWDAAHVNPAATPYFTAVESDSGTNVLVFTVDPSRFERTYTLSIAPADGLVNVLSGTATVPAGATSGSFSFAALDGVEFDCTNVVYWVTNTAPDGVTVVRQPTNEWSDAVAFAETNVCRASPLYDASIVSADGFSTNVAIVVANAAPTITNAIFYGYVIPGDPGFGISPEIYVFGLGAAATDVAADSSLRYLWWATTNKNWAANNLDWAVTNNDWAADVAAEWEYFNADDPAILVSTNWVDYPTAWPPADYDGKPHYYTVSTNYASFFAPQTQTAVDGTVTNGIDLYVARGVGMPLPFGYNVKGISPGASWGTAPFVVVLTVLDKDGGAAIVTFPQKPGAADYDADWAWNGVNIPYMLDGIAGDETSDAVYEARFTDVSGTNVAFVVWVSSGTPAASDKLELQSATTVTGAWTKLRDVPAGMLDFSGGEAPFNVTPAGTGAVRFYRIVKP